MLKRAVFSGLIALLILAALPLGQPEGRRSYAQEERLRVVTTYSILGDVVQNVAGDAANVTVLMPVGADPHGFQPSAQDIAQMVDADVVFINGANFEEGIIEIFEDAGDEINAKAVSSCVPIWPFGGSHDHEHEHEDGDEHEHEEGEEHEDEADHEHEEGEEHEDEADHEHEEGEEHEDEADHEHEEDEEHHGEIGMMCAAHMSEMEALLGYTPEYYEDTLGPLHTLECGGHEHEEEGGEGEHEHGEGECDPHLWMDPHNVVLWTLMIRDTLSELDPDNAAVYAENADNYLAQLAEVIEPSVALVETIPSEDRVLISNHLSFGYIAYPFEFETVRAVIPGGGTAAEPSAREIVQLIELIEAEGVPAIFSESTVSPDLVDQIAEETGAQVYKLYTGSLTDADGPATTYLDYIQYNYSTIAGALTRR
jgi:ABC-type Zn uptake system ZnuABC Zn-binding protein ZnuA